MLNKNKITIFWFRRDLRLMDNHGLFQALSAHKNVLPIFIFDKNILDDLENQSDRRISFIYQNLKDIHTEISSMGSGLTLFNTQPLSAFKTLIQQYNIDAVITNEDYEPYARKRDKEIAEFLNTHSINFKAFKDQIIFEKSEIVKDDGNPYQVFTPYSRKWKSKLKLDMLASFDTTRAYSSFLKYIPAEFPAIESLGFRLNIEGIPTTAVDNSLLKSYKATRDIPSIKGTSRLGVHLRFGTVSIRQLVSRALDTSETFLNELIWREFYMMILYHYPKVVNHSFRPKYDSIPWRNNEEEFEVWCTGKTGYPIVDAGMRELVTTGYMHNRVRMVTASFLTKHLLIDWRWGESFFAKYLLDFELASNNGGWQWAAGTGCDAAPYFRVFNPYLQAKKFDPNNEYIKQWVPEYDTPDYPLPIVEHKFARLRAINTYKETLNNI